MLDTSSLAQYLPPQNIEAEQYVLGGILLDPKALSRIRDILEPEAFYVQAHKEIYRAALALDRQCKPTDLIVVSSYLQDKGKLDDIGGIDQLFRLVDRTVSAANIDKYAELVNEKYIRRKAIEAGQKVIELGFDRFHDLDGYLERVATIMQDVIEFRKPGEDRNLHRFQRTIEAVKTIEQTIIDPAYKQYRMMTLSRELGVSIRCLQTLYTKYLASQENESIMTIDKLKEQYGSNVQDWFLHGFAPKGSVVLLHALGGTGKTRLIYDWIYCMVTGSPWNGFQVTAPSRRVLIVQTDESQSDLLGALDTRGFTNDMPVRVKTRWTAEHMAALRQDIMEWRPEVILIDSLTSISRNSIFSENDTEYARPVLEMRDLAQEFGCLIYLIHHSNSEGGSRGTKAIVNSVSHVLSLKRPEGNSDPRTLDRLLVVEKSRSRAPAKYKLTYDPENGLWECEDSDPDPDRPTKERIVEFLLRNANTAYEPIEVANALGSSTDRVRSLLYDLAAHGEISRKRRYQQGGGYLYFMLYEGDRVVGEGDRLPPRSPSQNTPITFPITFEKSLSERVSGEGDRGDRKNDGDRLLDGQKNAEYPITFSQNDHGERVSEGDREGDRKVIAPAPDHLLVESDDRQEEPASAPDKKDGSEWVRWNNELYRVVGSGFGTYTLRRSGQTKTYKAPRRECEPVTFE